MMNETANETKTPASFSIIALLFGMLALTGSVGHFWLGPIEPPPSLEDTIADQAVKIRDKVVSRLKGGEAPVRTVASDWGPDRIAMAAIAITSLLAIFLSVIGFIRHEPIRVVGSAVVLGGTALALQYLIIAIGAIVVAIILGAVLNGLDFGI